MDGKQQRRALTAAEQALHALRRGDPDRAREAAARAAELDQVGLFASLPHVVGVGADDIEAQGSVQRVTWMEIAAALGPGPLAAFAEQAAGRP